MVACPARTAMCGATSAVPAGTYCLPLRDVYTRPCIPIRPSVAGQVTLAAARRRGDVPRQYAELKLPQVPDNRVPQCQLPFQGVYVQLPFG
jgi:hypothetical protein